MSATRPLLALLLCLTLLAPAAAEAKSHPPKQSHAVKSHKKHKAKKHRKHVKKRKLRAAGDRDRDGLTNGFERRARTNPRKADSDRDGVLDPREDSDADGMPNAGEQMTRMNPRKRDTDVDGILDGDENAGVVTAVTDSSLTIALAKGGELVAAFGDDTDVLCGGAGAAGGGGGQGADDVEINDDDAADSDDDFWPVDDDDSSDAPSGFAGDDDSAPASPFGPEDDEDDDFGLRGRSVRLADGGCRPQVGDIVYQADVDPDSLVLLALDLLGL